MQFSVIKFDINHALIVCYRSMRNSISVQVTQTRTTGLPQFRALAHPTQACMMKLLQIKALAYSTQTSKTLLCTK